MNLFDTRSGNFQNFYRNRNVQQDGFVLTSINEDFIFKELCKLKSSAAGRLEGALDKHEYVAAVLTGLSKAFDSLLDDILLSKLSAYGLRNEYVQLLNSYLSGRKQQIKLNNIVSSWSVIKKGIPQGSILGPLLFNVFINDIFYFIEHGPLYNYAFF